MPTELTDADRYAATRFCERDDLRPSDALAYLIRELRAMIGPDGTLGERDRAFEEAALHCDRKAASYEAEQHQGSESDRSLCRIVSTRLRATAVELRNLKGG